LGEVEFHLLGVTGPSMLRMQHITGFLLPSANASPPKRYYTHP
jgi:hypothetical protein